MIEKSRPYVVYVLAWGQSQYIKHILNGDECLGEKGGPGVLVGTATLNRVVIKRHH